MLPYIYIHTHTYRTAEATYIPDTTHMVTSFSPISTNIQRVRLDRYKSTNPPCVALFSVSPGPGWPLLLPSSFLPPAHWQFTILDRVRRGKEERAPATPYILQQNKPSVSAHTQTHTYIDTHTLSKILCFEVVSFLCPPPPLPPSLLLSPPLRNTQWAGDDKKTKRLTK